MNAFVNGALQIPDTVTENGAGTFSTSLDAHVDLFYLIGAARQLGEDHLAKAFDAAFRINPSLAVRILLWARDVRGGAGERQVFRRILAKLPAPIQLALIPKVVELGRWDDLLTLINSNDNVVALTSAHFWKQWIADGNQLAAKWAPRKGIDAVRLRTLWNMSPKQYRKFIVAGTNVVEQKMCARRWDDIEFSHVPSVAAARYSSAFARNAAEKYAQYKASLAAGTSKINASAIFPHDVVVAATANGADVDVIEAQWKALPDYTNGKASDVLVMSDVSGSMSTIVSGRLAAIDVSIALGLYISERQPGAFKDLVLTFSGESKFHKVRGATLRERVADLLGSTWGMNTNLYAAFQNIIGVARDHNVPAEQMPKTLLILSDMEFDAAVGSDRTTLLQAGRKLFESNGYVMPTIVFWNLASQRGAVPARSDDPGVALVSGFSPAVLKSVLAGDKITPETVMLNAVMSDRYFVSGVTS